MSENMTKADRDALIKIARGRARLAKSALAERERILTTEIEESLIMEFRLRDDVEDDVRRMAEEAIAKLNEQICDQARLMGFSDEHVPQATLPYRSRYDTRGDKAKEQAHHLALTRLASMRASAAKAIEERLLTIEERLIVGGLESEEARGIAESLPAADDLMPSLTLDDIGVRTWQPAADAARELLAIPSGADRRRKLIMRAIALNPGASSRRIAEITGFDPKTVRKYREGQAAITGDFPSATDEFPDGDEEFPAEIEP